MQPYIEPTIVNYSTQSFHSFTQQKIYMESKCETIQSFWMFKIRYSVSSNVARLDKTPNKILEFNQQVYKILVWQLLKQLKKVISLKVDN